MKSTLAALVNYFTLLLLVTVAIVAAFVEM